MRSPSDYDDGHTCSALCTGRRGWWVASGGSLLHPAAAAPAAYGCRVFLLFGFGSKERVLGPGAVRTCPNCANTTTWTRVRVVKQVTVFFLPIARWGRRQLEICGICGATAEV
jgi:hypothetical protein